MQIIPLSEGEFTVSADKIFKPFDSTVDKLEDRETGAILVEVQPFLIITGTDYILLDTGLGVMHDGELQIHKNLCKHNIEPSSITKVIMSHLHKDHANGMSFVDEFGDYKLSFENATYYIYKAEHDYAMSNTSKSYVPDNFSFLEFNEQVILFNNETGTLAPGIEHALSGGHCKHHQVIKITDGTETIFYCGDEASQLKQLKLNFIAKYDYDGRKAAELRKQYAQEGKENNYTFLFYHDIATPFAKL